MVLKIDRKRAVGLEFVEGLAKGASRSFAAAARLNLIDCHMRPLVFGLNSLPGVETLACCEGHGIMGRLSEPYVAFVASADVAWRFQIALDEANIASHQPLAYWWDMRARYRPDGILVYHLVAPTLNRHLWVTRRKLNRDFAALLALFKTAYENRI